jgi:hypothetical protein
MMACVLVGLVVGLMSEMDFFKGKEKETVFEFPK